MKSIIVCLLFLAANFGFAEDKKNIEIEEVDVSSKVGEVAISMNPELVKKLNSKEITDIIEYAIKRQNPRPEPALPEDILVPFIVFGAIVGIVFLSFYFPYRKARDMQETVREIIREKRDIPDSFFSAMDQKKMPTPQSDLRKGVLLMALGFGIIGVTALANPNSASDGSWAAGFIPLFLGVAYFILWVINRKNTSES